MNKIFQIHHIYALILFNLLSLSFTCNTYSQNSCNSPNNCIPFGTPFGVSQQSISTTLQPGQKAIYNIVVYKGFIYRVSLCSNKNIGRLYFRILSTYGTNNVLFDSSNLDTDKQEKILSVKESCNLKIEVAFHKQELKTKHNKRDDACINVLIEYYKTDNTY